MKNFWYLFAAYTVIWTALFAYVVYLARKNEALQADIEALRQQVEKFSKGRESS